MSLRSAVGRGFSLLAKALLPITSYARPYPSPGSGGWQTIALEGFAGAWQQNMLTVATTRDLLSFPPIYSCVTLIAGDIAKLRMRLTALLGSVTPRNRTGRDIWLESEVPTTSPFLRPLRTPNAYQTPYQFWTAWIVSRLLHGNAYVLKVRDNRGIGEGNGNVRALHVLDPCLVRPLQAETGDVFYELRRDYLSGIDSELVTIPASEIIHDRVTPLWHPLIGVSPLYAAQMSGTQGLNITQNAAKFFGNMSRPSGILVAPGPISAEQMAAIKTAWQDNYSGNNAGKTAVLGDGMKYEPLSIEFDKSQMTEQAQDAARWVAMAFHVPPYKLGLDGGTKFNNMQQQDGDYLKQCLQTHMESMEQSLDAGLELPANYRSQFDEDGLLRMDALSRAQTHQARIAARFEAPNEARADEDMPPVDGGDEPFAQQQDWPISTLAKRPPPDANPEPAAPAAPVAEPAPADPEPQKAANVYPIRPDPQPSAEPPSDESQKDLATVIFMLKHADATRAVA